MPKPTFWNLPAAKREALLAIMIEEFAEQPYALASVSRIVERAGIAKGSIYQYFEHKQDLFLFLIDHAAAEQLRLLGELAPADPQADFFTLLRWQMSASVRVGAATPQLTRLLYRAVSAELPFREEVEQRLQRANAAHMTALVQRGIEQGDLDPEIDPELAAAVLRGITATLGDLILQRLGLTLQQAAADVERMAGPEIERIFDGLLRILRQGLQRRQ
jgi:AcrR family transcriptional regulator